MTIAHVPVAVFNPTENQCYFRCSLKHKYLISALCESHSGLKEVFASLLTRPWIWCRDCLRASAAAIWAPLLSACQQRGRAESPLLGDRRSLAELHHAYRKGGGSRDRQRGFDSFPHSKDAALQCTLSVIYLPSFGRIETLGKDLMVRREDTACLGTKKILFKIHLPSLEGTKHCCYDIIAVRTCKI